MILAENCEIDRIKKIAEDHGFKFELLQQQKIKWELNYIFEIIDNKVSQLLNGINNNQYTY